MEQQIQQKEKRKNEKKAGNISTLAMDEELSPWFTKMCSLAMHIVYMRTPGSLIHGVYVMGPQLMDERVHQWPNDGRLQVE